jgi:hypothetical protein
MLDDFSHNRLQKVGTELSNLPERGIIALTYYGLCYATAGEIDEYRTILGDWLEAPR